MSDIYQIGDFFHLQKAAVSGESTPTYKARIANINDDTIAIEMPLDEQSGKVVFLPANTLLEVKYVKDSGAKYTFSSTVTGREKDQVPLTLIKRPQPEDITKTQRRAFIRIPSRLDVSVHPVDNDAFPPFTAQTYDISGGGLSFYHYHENTPDLKEDVHLFWQLTLEVDRKTFMPQGRGKIVRVTNPREEGLPTLYSVQFTDVTEKERQPIIRYCFLRQLELRQKGIEM